MSNGADDVPKSLPLGISEIMLYLPPPPGLKWFLYKDWMKTDKVT